MNLNITNQGWIQKAELEAHKAFEKELDTKLRKKLFDLYEGGIKLADYVDWELDKPLTKIEVYKLTKLEKDFNNDLDKLINE